MYTIRAYRNCIYTAEGEVANMRVIMFNLKQFIKECQFEIRNLVVKMNMVYSSV